MLRMRYRKYTANIQSIIKVNPPAREMFHSNGFEAPGTAEGTISLVLLMAACISMVSNKLPWVRQYNQPMAIEIAITCNT